MATPLGTGFLLTKSVQYDVCPAAQAYGLLHDHHTKTLPPQVVPELLGPARDLFWPPLLEMNPSLQLCDPNHQAKNILSGD